MSFELEHNYDFINLYADEALEERRQGTNSAHI